MTSLRSSSLLPHPALFLLRSAPLALIGALFVSGAARADRRGEELLKQMDRALTAAKDQTFEMEMIISDPGKPPRRLGLKVYLKGAEKRRLDFVSPGDVKGVKLLVITRTQMYTYLPAYRKVRRIASHVRAQTMFGADFNFDDMSTVTYSESYQARLVSETKSHWILVAKRRPGAEVPYAKIQLRVRKAEMLPDLLLYFNDKGTKIKTETRGDVNCRDKVCAAGRLKMVDHTRNNHWTEIVRSNWEINTGLSDRLFSVRSLQR